MWAGLISSATWQNFAFTWKWRCLSCQVISMKQLLLIAYFGVLPAVRELRADSHQSDIGTIWSSGWFPTMWSMKLRQPEGLKVKLIFF